jgi:hypothetical protein
MFMAELAEHIRAVRGMLDSTLHKRIDEMTSAKDSRLISFVQLGKRRLALLQLQSCAMPKKKKKGTFDVPKIVKAKARDVIGAPKSTKAIPDAKSKQEHKAAKHKPSLGKLLSED